jgi:plasmid stabilization system protein ParE
MDRSKEEAPKTLSLKITEQALQNIDQITGYIAFAKHEPLSAVRVGEMLFKTIDRIEKNPYAFRECREIPSKNKIYRQAFCLSWLIIYKIKIPEIIILGIIHSHRKPSKRKILRTKKIR